MKKLIVSSLIVLSSYLSYGATASDTNIIAGFKMSEGTNFINKIPLVVTNPAGPRLAQIIFTNISSIIDGTNVLNTNAVFTIVTNHLPWFNIVDFGAVGNGVKHNQTNIQNAINAAEAAGGGVVYVPKGDFLLGPTPPDSKTNFYAETVRSLLTISSNNVVILGDGMGQSKLRVISGPATPINLLAVGGVVGNGGVDIVSNRIFTTNNIIQGVTIDGGYFATVHDLTQLYFNYNMHIRNCEFLNVQEDAIDFQYGGDIFIDNVICRNIKGNGISAQNTYVRVTNSKFHGGGDANNPCIEAFDGQIILENVQVEDYPMALRTYASLRAYNCDFLVTNAVAGTTNIILAASTDMYDCSFVSKSVDPNTYLCSVTTNVAARFFNCKFQNKPPIVVDNASEFVMDGCYINAPHPSYAILCKSCAGSTIIKDNTFLSLAGSYSVRAPNNGERSSSLRIIGNVFFGGGVYSEGLFNTNHYIANNLFYNGAKLALWEGPLGQTNTAHFIVNNVWDQSSGGIDLVSGTNYFANNYINSLNYLSDPYGNIFNNNYVRATNGVFADLAATMSTYGLHNIKDGRGITNIAGNNVDMVAGAGMSKATNGVGQVTWTSTGSGINFTNSNILYVDTNGTTGVRGLISMPFPSITNALASAQEGDLVFLMPGVYPMETGARWKTGVGLAGSGIDVSIINFYNDSSITNGQPHVCIIPSNNFFMANLTISNRNKGYASSFGKRNESGDLGGSTNVYVKGVKMDGQTDVFYIRNTNYHQNWIIEDSILIGRWDVVMSAGALHDVTFKKCYLKSDGTGWTNLASFPIHGESANATLILAGAYKFYDCTIIATGSTNGAVANRGLATGNDLGFVAGSTIDAFNCTILASNAVHIGDASTTIRVYDSSTNHAFLTMSNMTVVGTISNTATAGSGDAAIFVDANGKYYRGFATNLIGAGSSVTNAILNLDGLGTNTTLTNFVALMGTNIGASNIFTTNLTVRSIQTNNYLGGGGYALVIRDNNGAIIGGFSTNDILTLAERLWRTNAADGSITNVNFEYHVRFGGITGGADSFGYLLNSGGGNFAGSVLVGSPTKIELQAAGGISAAGGNFSIDLNGNTTIDANVNVTGGDATVQNDVIVTDGQYYGNGGGLSNAASIVAGGGISISNFNNREWTVSSGPASWLPNLDYEVYYDPFGVADNSTGPNVGHLGWTGVSSGVGGGGIFNSNAVGHVGLTTITVSSSAHSIHSMYLSSHLNTKPTIPPVNAMTGWTNTWIWRLNGTNSLKAYLCFQAGNFTQAILENGVGIYLNTTNNNQIMGLCVNGSSATTTNLGTLQSGVWYKTRFGSTSAGTIFFSLNDGAMAHINSNVPTSALTPAASLIKAETTSASSLDLDAYLGVYTRQ